SSADDTGMPLEVDDGSSVFLVTSGPSAPLAVNGTIISHDDNVLVIRVDEPAAVSEQEHPELADRREIQRYPTWLDATVFGPRFPEGQAAVITDLSVVGAGIEVDRWED